MRVSFHGRVVFTCLRRPFVCGSRLVVPAAAPSVCRPALRVGNRDNAAAKRAEQRARSVSENSAKAADNAGAKRAVLQLTVIGPQSIVVGMFDLADRSWPALVPGGNSNRIAGLRGAPPFSWVKSAPFWRRSPKFGVEVVPVLLLINNRPPHVELLRNGSGRIASPRLCCFAPPATRLIDMPMAMERSSSELLAVTRFGLVFLSLPSGGRSKGRMLVCKVRPGEGVACSVDVPARGFVTPQWARTFGRHIFDERLHGGLERIVDAV